MFFRGPDGPVRSGQAARIAEEQTGSARHPLETRLPSDLSVAAWVVSFAVERHTKLILNVALLPSYSSPVTFG